MNDFPPSTGHPPIEPDLAEYRALCPQAVLGLVLGLLGIVAFLDPLAWLLPAAGVVVSLAALVRIARDPALAGNKLAWAGLTLSLVLGVAAPTDWYLYRWLVRREAIQYALPWFQLVGQREVHKAFLLTVDPQSRLPLDVSLPEMCRRAPQLCNDLEGYRKDAALRALESLGENRVRLCRVDDQTSGADRDFLRLVFEAAAAQGGPAGPVRIALNMERLRLRGAEGWSLGRAEWRILRAEILPM